MNFRNFLLIVNPERQPVITNNTLDKIRERAELKIRKPVPTPRKTVKELVKQYENNYKPVPAPRTKKVRPVPASRTRIHQTRKALKGFTKSFEISLKTNKDPLVH